MIDTDTDVLWSKKLNRELKITRTAKNLLLMEINQLWESPENSAQFSLMAEERNCLPSDALKTCDSRHHAEASNVESQQAPGIRYTASDEDQRHVNMSHHEPHAAGDSATLMSSCRKESKDSLSEIPSCRSR